ncbi:MAG: hypothetical protein NVSMB9_07620 [Isosphaeraceae bacterium]
MKIEIVRGPEAESLLAQDTFRLEWTRLLEECPWATTFQAPGFVSTWYHAYHGRFAPILVLSRADDGRLQGLLTLAGSSSVARFVVAGAGQSEYHAWLSPPELGDVFPLHALRSIRREVSPKELRFRYLPPGTPLRWLEDPEAKRTCLWKPRRRPLLRFEDGGAIEASLRKGGNRSRIQRLAKLGAVEFRRITDPEEFDQILDEVILCYDTRRLAINGIPPFLNDSVKKSFHQALMRVPGLLHVTVLKVGGLVAAAHLGACGHKEVQLGLLAHNPFLARFSPGKLLTLYLARMLREEGYEQLDLTAGGEAYKERFANAWDEVHTLGCFPTPWARTFSAIHVTAEDAAKSTFDRLGIRPAKARFVARELKRLGPVAAPAWLFQGARDWIRSRQERWVYSRGTDQALALDAPVRFRRDALEDLLKYDPPPGGASRQGLLAKALEHIENGQHVYTYVEDDRLLHIGWFIERLTEDLARKLLPGFPLSPFSSLVLDLLTLPGARGRGLALLALRAMLRDAARVAGSSGGRTFIALPSGSAAARRVVEKAGFTYERALFREP